MFQHPHVPAVLRVGSQRLFTQVVSTKVFFFKNLEVVPLVLNPLAVTLSSAPDEASQHNTNRSGNESRK